MLGKRLLRVLDSADRGTFHGTLRARQSLTLPQLGTDQPHGFVGGTGANAIASRGAEKRYGWDRAVISHDRSSRFFRIRFNVQY